MEKTETQAICVEVGQDLLNRISSSFTRLLIRHAIALLPHLTGHYLLKNINILMNDTVSAASDTPFILRIIVQSTLPNVSGEITAEAQPLVESYASSNDFSETCPACGVEIPLEDITAAVCSQGHHWGTSFSNTYESSCSLVAGRCSITSFILSSPMLRNCVGCCRKAFAAPSQSDVEPNSWLPPEAQGFFVCRLLEAVQCCIFCGNSFVSIL